MSDNQRIISGSDDHTIKIWTKNPSGEWSVETLKGHDFIVTTLQVLPDGRIVSGSWDNTVRVWDVETYALVNTLDHKSPVTSVAFNHDGSKIVSGSVEVANTLLYWLILSFKLDVTWLAAKAAACAACLAASAAAAV